VFTGLIEDTGKVASFVHRGEAGILTVETSIPSAGIAIGDSLAVNGVCLTVTAHDGARVTVDVSPESLSRTTIGSLKNGQRVNLERALRLGDRFGGHIVSGHVDCCGHLKKLELRSGNCQLHFTLPAEQCRYLIEKGSVAIDGISLTVNSVSVDGFAVNIIPHTYSATTLKSLRVGDRVNIETDIIGKYVERLASPWKSGSGVTLKTLVENGFM